MHSDRDSTARMLPALALALWLSPTTGRAGQSAAPVSGRAADAATPVAATTFDRALLVSVDGLRSDALIAGPPEDLPGFARLLRGASTLNARTDFDFTVTLPNHTGMLTGRPVLGQDGHGWTANDDAAPGETLHKQKGAYVAGVFDVAHDRGFRTALFAGKTKFALYDASWDAEDGAADAEGADDGRDKLDLYAFCDKSEAVADAVLRALSEHPRTLVFAHFAVPDLAAHARGWDVTRGSPYLKAVAAVDREIGRILDAIEASESLRGRTAIVLTADHGGGAPLRSHDQPHMWVDYVIPFVVWTGGGEPLDLYAINSGTRRDPGLGRPPTRAEGLPPIRNADAGNLALALLGLPPVPGSTINAKQDLAVRAPR